MASTLVDLTVPCDEAAPAVVRAAISELAGVERPVLEEAKLVASELVTNAVRHSSCTDQESLAVRVARHGRLRISVRDPGRGGGEAEIVDRRMELGGIGLRIVSKLADRWGSERRADGYEVWAELAGGVTADRRRTSKVRAQLA